MSYYRNIYLRSEHWQTVRSRQLMIDGGKCRLCKTTEGPLDAHHLTYKRMGHEKGTDLKLLCRKCHNEVHALMKKYPKIKALGNGKQWGVILHHLRDKINESNLIMPSKQSKRFSKCRNVLVNLRIAKRSKMKAVMALKSVNIPWHMPILALEMYIKVTGIDPRYRRERIGPHKLLTFPTHPVSARP